MALRAAAHLPRLVVLGAVFLFAGATLTYGAAQRISADAAPKTTAPVAPPTAVVPDLTGQAFVFAKGSLEDAGFAWHVTGPVHGYAVNRVVSQSPAGGTNLRDTGAPTVIVTLARTSYPETGEPEDDSPYIGPAVVPAAAPLVTKPPVQIPSATAKPAAPKPTTAKKPTATPAAASAKRPPAFVVPGAPKEPLDEITLPARAQLL